MIGCDCEVCRSPDPRDQRFRSSIYIQTPECSFVVDTGTDFRTQALRANIRQVDAVVEPLPAASKLNSPCFERARRCRAAAACAARELALEAVTAGFATGAAPCAVAAVACV